MKEVTIVDVIQDLLKTLNHYLEISNKQHCVLVGQMNVWLLVPEGITSPVASTSVLAWKYGFFFVLFKFAVTEC